MAIDPDTIREERAKLRDVEGALRRQMGTTRDDLSDADVRAALEWVHPQMIVRLVRKFAERGHEAGGEAPRRGPSEDVREGDTRGMAPAARAYRGEREAFDSTADAVSWVLARNVVGSPAGPAFREARARLQSFLRRTNAGKEPTGFDLIEHVARARGMNESDTRLFLCKPDGVEKPRIAFFDPPPRSIIPRDCLPDVPEVLAAFEERFHLFATISGEFFFTPSVPDPKNDVGRDMFDPKFAWVVRVPVPLPRADRRDPGPPAGPPPAAGPPV